MAIHDALLQQFLSAKIALVEHQQNLRKRLEEIDAALGLVMEAPGRTRRGSGPRPDNDMTLPEAITKATAKSPLSLRAIVEAVEKLGYRFSSANPYNSVGAYLYGPGKKLFKRQDGKFSPAK